MKGLKQDEQIVIRCKKAILRKIRNNEQEETSIEEDQSSSIDVIIKNKNNVMINSKIVGKKMGKAGITHDGTKNVNKY